jgi:hypothetical protein
LINNRLLRILTLCLLCFPIAKVIGQVVLDSVATQTTDSVVLPIQPTTSKNSIDAPIDYHANDSIVFTENGICYMYGSGNIVYKQEKPIELQAERIHMVMDSSVVHATGIKDSLGNDFGTPIFKDGNDEYNAKALSYNFSSRKGYIKGGVTQQGEGYIVSDKTKKMSDDEMCMQGGKYTTCDNHDHPHFYLQLTKAKVQPGHYIAAGPAYLVVEDVPLPLAIPFGFFPFTSQYSSGLIMPSYGDEMERGFFLKDGGYYFAINDYFDLELTGELYTKGTWGINLASNYKKRYKFNGRFNINYRQDVKGEKDMPDYSKSKNFKISWTHQQDAKASQYSSLSASVDFATSGYNQSNINNYYNPTEQSKNITSSSINYTQRFPESPWSISLNALVSQRTQDSTISISLPNLRVSMSRLYPFKRKKAVGKERFYEKIALSYTMTFNNSIDTKESKLFQSSFTKDWKNGIDHNLPISASFNLFKYLNISPSINYHERWYFNRINKAWDTPTQQEVRDTTNGFYRVYDFNFSLSLQTKIYGYYIPIRKIFGDKVDRIRHVFTPSISFNYHPDFGTDLWGFYSSYDKAIIDKNNANKVRYETVTYSPYSHGIFGVPSQGMSGTLSFMLANNLEMKVRDTSDSTITDAYKKISLIDNFSIGGGYNFAADSMRWANFTTNLRIKITKDFSLNLRGEFDPYMYGLNDYGTPVRINKLRWNNGKFPRFLGTSTSFQYTFNNDTFKKKDKKKGQENSTEEHEKDNMNPQSEAEGGHSHNEQDQHKHESVTEEDGFEKLEIPWSFSFNYSLRWGVTNEFDYDEMEYKRGFTHNLSFNGFVNPTKKWKISFSGSYDFTLKQITQTTLSITRDLHCWTLSASVNPFGLYKSYMVTIGVNASMLKDLKYEKRSDSSSDINWF